MDLFLRIYRHLLPKARAWLLFPGKTITQFFVGLTGLPADIRVFFDSIWDDISPQTTRELEAWERQFNLTDPGTLTEAQRRDRLAGAWQAMGGQSPRYIQDTLQDAGFPVYVHEWWEPGPPTVPVTPPVVRDPRVYLRGSSLPANFLTGLGETLAQLGEPVMLLGNTNEPQGYPLVNKIFSTRKNYLVELGEPGMQLGEPAAMLGNFDGFDFIQKEYTNTRSRMTRTHGRIFYI